MININSNDGMFILKTITIKFDQFFAYQTILKTLENSGFYPKEPNPDELTLSFTYHYSYEGIIVYITNLCKPLNIQFITSLEITEDIK